MSKRKDNKCTQDYECEILKVAENRIEKLSIQAQHEGLEHEKYSYPNTKRTNNKHLKTQMLRCFEKLKMNETEQTTVPEAPW